MKRFALVLAAAVLGAGCHASSTPPPPTPSGTLDLSWSFVRTRNAAGSPQVTYGCSTAGIDTVVVTAGGGSVALPCRDAVGDGGAIALLPGTYNVVVTAYRGGTGGVALYDAQFSATIFVDQITSLAPQLFARFGQLQINTDFVVGPTVYTTCFGAGVTTYSFNLVDSAGTSVYSSGNIACTDPPGITFGASNPVDLDTYTIRVVAFGPSFDYDSAVLPSCSSPVFPHYGDDVGTFAWNLPVYDVTGLPPAQLCP